MSEHVRQARLFQWINIAARWGFISADNWLHNGQLPTGERTNPHPMLLWAHAIPNGGFRTKVGASKLKAEGVVPGVADIFIPITRVFGAGLYIEMKDGHSRPSKAQAEFGAAVQTQGYRWHCVGSEAEAALLIKRYVLGQ